MLDESNVLLQRLYYAAGTVAVVASGVWFLVSRARTRLAAIEDRIDSLEARTVTAESLQRIMSQCAEHEKEWHTQHDRLTDTMLKQLDEGLKHLRQEVSEIRAVLLNMSRNGRSG